MVIKQLLATLHYLSIDICFSAVVLSAFICQLFGIEIKVAEMTVLWLSVFVFYNLDHLIDARFTKAKVLTPRRLFFVKRRGIIITLLALSLTALLILIPLLPFRLILVGLIVTAFITAYFASLRLAGSSIYHKEISGALVYAMGIFVIPYSYVTSANYFYLAILFAQISLLAFLNLLVIAYFDRHNDMQDGQMSILTTVGEKLGFKLINLVGLLSILLVTAVLVTFGNFVPVSSQVVILAITLLTTWIPYQGNWMYHGNRYRILGDSALFLPIIYLIG